jgi:hypothetical protein
MADKFSYDDKIDGIRRGDMVRWIATLQTAGASLLPDSADLAIRLYGVAEELGILLGEGDEED